MQQASMHSCHNPRRTANIQKSSQDEKPRDGCSTQSGETLQTKEIKATTKHHHGRRNNPQ